MVGQRGSRGELVPTWGDLEVSDTPGFKAPLMPGSFKINSGLTTVGTTAGVEIEMPPGFDFYELWVNNALASAGDPILLQFSYDGGAGYPGASNQYFFAYLYTGNMAASGSTPYASGSLAGAYLFTGAPPGSGARNFARVYMPRVGPSDVQTVHVMNNYYTGSYYLSMMLYAHQALTGGPPTHVRIVAGGSSTLLAGLKWQMNGIK